MAIWDDGGWRELIDSLVGLGFLDALLRGDGGTRCGTFKRDS